MDRIAAGAPPLNWERLYAGRAKRITASEIRELLRLLARPGIISFAGGIPDPGLFPSALFHSACDEILGRPETAREALQYSVSEGLPELRAWVCDHMRERGVTCSVDNVLITNGSQQALDFLGKLFLASGDRVLVERPTFLGALQAFSAYEAEFVELEAADEAAGAQPAKLIYVMPDFRNPTGTSLSVAERAALLQRARRLGCALVEDAAYEALSFDRPPPPPILALEQADAGSIEAGRVIYCGTFSKTVAPALRVAWVIAPAAVIRKLVLIKQASDLHTSTFAQLLMLHVIRRCLPDHVELLRDAYRARREAMLEALGRFMPEGVRWTTPGGGLFVWVILPETVDATQLLDRAVRELNVAFVPGRAFFAADPRPNMVRLSYSLADPQTIAEGVERLSRLVR